ncbi:hypothetical protein ACL1C3_13895, partial [Corynebacterium striatum]
MFNNLDHGSVSGVSVQRMLTKQRGARVTMPVVFTCGLGVVEHPESDQSPYLGVIDHGLSQTPQVWMDLQVYEHDGGLMLNMDAVEAIFPDDMVAELFTSLTATLSHLAESPELWNAPTSTIAPTTNAPTADRINDTDRELPGADKSLLGLYQKGPDPRKVDTSGVSYAAWVSVADVSASKSSGARRLHQECRLRV